MVFKKYFWFIHVALVALLAWTAADLAVSVVGGRLAGRYHVRPAAGSPETKPMRVPPSLAAFDLITRHNMFNPGKTLEPPSVSVPERPARPREKRDLPVTELKVRLHGTAVAEDPAGSFAVIQDQVDGNKQKLLGVGGTVQGAVVKEIRWREVVVERNGREELLLMQDGQTDKRPGSRPGPEPSSSPSSAVRQMDATTYVVDREEVEKMVGNINQFMTQLRVRPYFVDGKPAGYLITDIRKGSVIDELGIRNGDVLQAVNGTPITRPEHAFSAYRNLLDESEISLEIKRGPSSQVLTYQLK